MVANVKVTGLLKRFGSMAAVAGIDFEVQAGHFYTLLGPSGCGKTTTLRMIAGLEKPDGGEIRVGDRVVSAPERGIHLPPEQREIGMVFQSYAVWPHMTVFENVAFPLQEKRVPRKEIESRVMGTLEMVGLADLARRPAPALSGGQQQRVALARALVGNPQVLLLDEPLSNLDARLREQMRFEIRTMQVRLGITMIFVTHDQLEAMTLSDRVCIMNSGKIEQIGEPQQVYEHPKSRYVMDFLGNVNYLPARIFPLPDALRVVVAGRELRLPFADGWSDGQEALVAFRSEAVEVDPLRGDITGTLAAVSYLGGAMEYVVTVGTAAVRLRVPAGLGLAVGTTIGLRLALADVSLWPAGKRVD